MVELILIGGGGHCKSCISVIESTGDFRIRGIMDSNPPQSKKLLGYKFIEDEDFPGLVRRGLQFCITVGQIESSKAREELFCKVREFEGTLPVIVSPKATCYEAVDIGLGTIVMHGAIINFEVDIGENCIINTGAIIEHDCVIGDHTHISTGAIVNGGCSIGRRCFIGSGSVIRNYIEIADDVVIGSGSMVTKSITEAGTYYGNPACIH